MKKFVLVAILVSSSMIKSSVTTQDQVSLYKMFGVIIGGFAAYGAGQMFFGTKTGVGMGVLGVVAGYKYGGSLGDKIERLDRIDTEMQNVQGAVNFNTQVTVGGIGYQAFHNNLMARAELYRLDGNIIEARRCFAEAEQLSRHVLSNLPATPDNNHLLPLSNN